MVSIGLGHSLVGFLAEAITPPSCFGNIVKVTESALGTAVVAGGGGGGGGEGMNGFG